MRAELEAVYEAEFKCDLKPPVQTNDNFCCDLTVSSLWFLRD